MAVLNRYWRKACTGVWCLLFYKEVSEGQKVEIPGEIVKRSSRSKANLPEYSYPSPDKAALADKALIVTERLAVQYGPARWSRKDPLSMLVDIILSHRTRDQQTAAAYAALRNRYATWEDLRDAPTAEVEATIQGVTWPELKAPRLQALLRRITAEQGSLNLDFLKDWPVEEGAEWLNRLEGVGPKTTACVLLFSCRKPILPVDTHVHRVSIRLGLIGPKVTAEAAHGLLQALLPNEAQTIYNFHKGLLRHGQQVCVYDGPRCQQCVLRDICGYYRQVVLPKTRTLA
jgi:endonuclease-3